jgi:hypothetical protein
MVLWMILRRQVEAMRMKERDAEEEIFVHQQQIVAKRMS